MKMYEYLADIMVKEYQKWVRNQFEKQYQELKKHHSPDKALDMMLDRMMEYRKSQLKKQLVHGLHLHMLQLGRYIKK